MNDANNIGKVCSKCKLEKSLEFFNNNKGGLFGRHSTCRICMNNNSKNGI